MNKTINGLFVGTRFGVLCLAALGIIASVVLFFLNLGIGFSSAVLCIAALALCIALVSLLIPKAMTKKRGIIATACLIAAFAIVAVTYYSNGGFPHMNLLFTAI